MITKHTAKNKGKLIRKGIRLFEGDAELIDEHFPNAGHNVIIRSIVHDFCKRILEASNQKEMPNVTDYGTIDLTSTGSGEGEPG